MQMSKRYPFLTSRAIEEYRPRSWGQRLVRFFRARWRVSTLARKCGFRGREARIVSRAIRSELAQGKSGGGAR